MEDEIASPSDTMETVDSALEDTAGGTPSDAKSTRRQYSRTKGVWLTFLSELDLAKHQLSSKEIYLPGQSNNYVNRGLARAFVRFFVQNQGRTKTNISMSINFLQRLLDDSLNKDNKVAKRGAIKDDAFFKKFKKSMEIELADESRKTVKDLHAQLSSQIPRSKELALVDACYTLLFYLL
jgi:hypothetical protein